MEQYCRLLLVPEAQWIPFASTFMKDNAALWWRSFSKSMTGQEQTWEEFVTALTRQYVPVNNTINAYDRLRRFQRTSVQQYSHEFRALMLELPDMDPTTRLNYYTQGLKEHIRPLVAIQQPTTIEEAEAVAERIDSVTFRSTTRNTRNPYRSPGGTAPMELDAIGRRTLTDRDRERLRREGKCFYCREGKHMAKDCPERRMSRTTVAIVEGPESESGKEESQ